ncbi:hypothetical protein ISF_03038 [Cordyceps fumosorosea ARSEF 2679]|uniref:SRR1-like domain-containing protein n=1 Tax=Cordyceps fumosorosea (strain ARSEF 2679) TaxID=1081104 RepID=A0A168B8J6_CORFA|nr:hypothetical protein ISF_03038 [Cordyceps fumosorosea ARSEF 2679]OAA69768.1 hypothetical protein ISF_03038 [Cordyceps fumosorosea ARSEF 2679]
MNSPTKILPHDCTAWRRSSQAAADLYDSGVKLWTKQGLKDVEQQLEDLKSRQVFSIRSIDGTFVHIENPMFNVTSPIWKPQVDFRDYWRLVKDQPVEPAETWYCTMVPEWFNTSAGHLCSSLPNLDSLFEENRRAWAESDSRQLLTSQLRQLSSVKAVRKILCFGLGDFCANPPEWMRRESGMEPAELERSFVSKAMLQHCISLTLREICSDLAGYEVQLFAQDPRYTDETVSMLSSNDCSIVGEFSAGGFAEIDDGSLIFSAFIGAPLKQIIADLARPAIIIETGYGVLNNSMQVAQETFAMNLAN